MKSNVVTNLGLQVWAGPLSNSRWAVALLNRDPLANATITVDWSMLNASATATFALLDVWAAESVGAHTGSFTADIPPQAVSYLILTPA